MKLADSFKASSPDDIKAAFAGGKLVVYSVARPSSPNVPVQRSGVLATFVFAAPAFNVEAPPAEDGTVLPLFVDNPVVAAGIGTPGFARAFKADGTVIADFSAGSGNTDIKFNQVSTVTNYPVTLTKFKFELPAQ
jgi:hypothetical protein